MPLALQCVWPSFLLLGLYWVPESPRWLIMHDRVEEAQAILERLHTTSKDTDNEYAVAEFYQIQKQVVIDRTLGNSWMHMFKKPSYRRRAFLAIATTGIIQCSGVLVINSTSLSLPPSISTIISKKKKLTTERLRTNPLQKPRLQHR